MRTMQIRKLNAMDVGDLPRRDYTMKIVLEYVSHSPYEILSLTPSCSRIPDDQGHDRVRI